jgi:MinD-like ATPase involved in chromosome partitioning or flagellar assembly
MGKGIEDISHFFISMAEPAASKPVVPKRIREEPSRRDAHRVIAVMSAAPAVSGLLAASRLATVFSLEGKKVLLMDIGSSPETVASVLRPLQIHPSLNDLLNQTNKTITHASSNGFQVLSFQLQEGELDQFKPEEREILFQMLCREEQQCDVLLIHLNFDPTRPALLSHLRSICETVMVVPARDLQRAYGALKMVYHLQPDMRVGLIEADSGGQRKGGLAILVEAVRKFLAKSPIAVGTLPRWADTPGPVVIPEKNEIHRDFLDVGNEILASLAGGEDRRLFFERIENDMVINRRGMERERS